MDHFENAIAMNKIFLKNLVMKKLIYIETNPLILITILLS